MRNVLGFLLIVLGITKSVHGLSCPPTDFFNDAKRNDLVIIGTLQKQKLDDHSIQHAVVKVEKVLKGKTQKKILRIFVSRYLDPVLQTGPRYLLIPSWNDYLGGLWLGPCDYGPVEIPDSEVLNFRMLYGQNMQMPLAEVENKLKSDTIHAK